LDDVLAEVPLFLSVGGSLDTDPDIVWQAVTQIGAFGHCPSGGATVSRDLSIFGLERGVRK